MGKIAVVSQMLLSFIFAGIKHQVFRETTAKSTAEKKSYRQKYTL